MCTYGHVCDKPYFRETSRCRESSLWLLPGSSPRGRSSPAMSLTRTLSSETYAKLLANPNLNPQQRAQLEKMKAKRAVKEQGGASTNQSSTGFREQFTVVNRSGSGNANVGGGFGGSYGRAAAPQRIGGMGTVGPAWTRGEIEAPAGEQDMGGWTAGVYTAEQQQRLGVDAQGSKVQTRAPARAGGMMGTVGPAWTRGEIEPPAGEQDMGGWTAGVYTAEQQQRLGVDTTGAKVQNAIHGGNTVGGGGFKEQFTIVEKPRMQRTMSSETYEKMLANPNLTPTQRAQVPSPPRPQAPATRHRHRHTHTRTIVITV